ncbi:hypothetical protein HK405_004585 [Cladochytrium tenue]|nr:hypothetical protein HK405_004585 [Cladochytrium tenue]
MLAVDHGGQARWRRALFRLYYAGRTFRAGLPADYWKLPPDGDERSWPRPSLCGQPGGPCRVKRIAGRSVFAVKAPAGDEDEKLSVSNDEASPSESTSDDYDSEDEEAGGGSKDFCRFKTAHNDITEYFTCPETDGISLDTYSRCGFSLISFQSVRIQRRLVGAGKEGWKAFTVYVYASFDPEGRLDALMNYRFFVPDVVGDKKEWYRRIALAANVAASGWKPAATALPFRVLSDYDGGKVTTHHALLLPPNIDLAPGFVILSRAHTVENLGQHTSIAWEPWFGRAKGRFGLHEYKLVRYHYKWTSTMWNGYFRMLFLCLDGEFRVDFESLKGSLFWKFACSS